MREILRKAAEQEGVCKRGTGFVGFEEIKWKEGTAARPHSNCVVSYHVVSRCLKSYHPAIGFEFPVTLMKRVFRHTFSSCING